MIIKTKEPMKQHTTFKVGGKADVYCIPESEYELVETIKFLHNKNLPMYVIGNGSNILVSDEALHACVIEINRKYFGNIEVNNTDITVGAGALLSKVCEIASENNLSGLENLFGIPGTIGGAIYMNAGAFNREMKDVVSSVTVITKNGEIKTFNNNECEFSYRHSIFQNDNYVVLSATLKLNNGDASNIKKTMQHFYEIRKNKQPIDKPSAGSFFKRPPNAFAAQLIDESNLKGYSVNNAQISTKHCGFIVNNGNAKAKDIIKLKNIIQKKVFTYFGINLEIEVKMWGKF